VTVTTKKHDSISVLEIEGRIDALTAAEFESRLLHVVENGATKIVLDFAGCDFINSSGLRILLVLRKRLIRDGTAAICNLQQHIFTVFEIAGFTGLFPVYTSRDEAIMALSTTSAPAA
jgi:anti-anti-sigma factor